MKTHLVRIGNSRGLRIPRHFLEMYRIGEGDELELEERADGIIIKPVPRTEGKLSWNEAYQQMAYEAAESSEWTSWNAVAGDGIDD